MSVESGRQIENGRTRVTRYRLALRHPNYYVIYRAYTSASSRAARHQTFTVEAW